MDESLDYTVSTVIHTSNGKYGYLFAWITESNQIINHALRSNKV